MRKHHILLFLMAVFAVVLPVLAYASPPDVCTMTAAENAQFAVTTDVQGTNDCPMTAATILGVMHELQLRGPTDESGIIASNDLTQAQNTAQLTMAEYAQIMATLKAKQETAATARSAPNFDTAMNEESSFKTSLKNAANQIALAGTEVSIVIKWNDEVSNTNQKVDQNDANSTANQIAENAGTTRAPTNTVEMRC